MDMTLTLLAARANYLGHYWNRPNFGIFQNTYRILLDMALFPILSGIILWGIANLFRRSRVRPSPAPERMHEAVAVIALALLPFCIFPLSYFIGSFVPRYILYIAVGITISHWFCWLIAAAAQIVYWPPHSSLCFSPGICSNRRPRSLRTKHATTYLYPVLLTRSKIRPGCR